MPRHGQLHDIAKAVQGFDRQILGQAPLNQDLLGLEVKDADNATVYGKITDVLRTGANDVYEITDDNGKKYLAPVIDEVITETNVDDGYVLIRPMKGIFDDED